jgi:cytochrome c oxidase subunit 2
VQTDVDKLSRNPDQVVEVVAFKWSWQFNYRDGIGPEAHTVASTLGTPDAIPLLVLPTGKKIRFEETSKDVVHSFWVVQMGIKVDANPGETTTTTVLPNKLGRFVVHSFWVPELLFKRDVFPGNTRNAFEVTLDKEGRYVGRCAELCGTYHAYMQFELVVVAPAKFDQFLAAKKNGASTADAMGAIGYTGDQRYAVTTKPFNTRRHGESWNQTNATAAGK